MYSSFKLMMEDNMSVHLHSWYKEECDKDVVLILHGMAEHAFRYNDFAEFLVGNGYQVIAPDHRGHGETGYEAQQLGHFKDEDGWQRVIQDIENIITWIKKENPNKDIIVLGHSMGSLLARTLIGQTKQPLKGAIISGTTLGGGKLKVLGGKALCGLYRRIKGVKYPAVLLDKISFGTYNKKIDNSQSKFDWLSRDEKLVKAYEEDPHCGFICSAGFFRDLLQGVQVATSSKSINGIPKELPLLMIAGDHDPVGCYGKEVLTLAKKMQASGLKPSVKLYHEGRHEMLNETNKEEVYKDILQWIEQLS